MINQGCICTLGSCTVKMIPTFPKFKKISKRDQKSVELYTCKYRPYSTFNFTNFWSWDTRGERKISKLNGNLVLFFTDYDTSKPFLSFLGSRKPVNTAVELLSYANSLGSKPSLRFVTKEAADQLHKSPKLNVKEDRGNFDYLYSTLLLTRRDGPKLKARRRRARQFRRLYPDAIFETYNFSDSRTLEHVKPVIRRWEENKKKQNKVYDLVHEEVALNRLLEYSHDKKLFLSCIYIDKKLIGFSIDEIIPKKKTALGHFVKADNSYRGVYEYFNEEVAHCLRKKGIDTWNWQQDLDIKGLRDVKMSYKPTGFLKKYCVSLRPEK